VTLRDAGYVLQGFKLVDQFPHTSHIEAVALLEFDPSMVQKAAPKDEIAVS
jgi:hypothetical protein